MPIIIIGIIRPQLGPSLFPFEWFIVVAGGGNGFVTNFGLSEVNAPTGLVAIFRYDRYLYIIWSSEKITLK
jgi:hypothetical protein